MAKTVAPAYELDAFSCMHCGVLSTQNWRDMHARPHASGGIFEETGWKICSCDHCDGNSYWHARRLIVPSVATVPAAHEDFPKGPKADYDEARDISGRSPKAAAALLRLCLQKLMVELGEKGKNINDDIASLVKKGLPVFVQQSLDFCRVVGNNAVHPLEISLDDTPEIALALFDTLNIIVESQIAVKRRIAEQYEKLPEGARAAIEKRDAAKQP